MSSAFCLGPLMTKLNTLEMTAGMLLIDKILNKTKLN